MTKLTHLDADGRAKMVDVGAKAITERVAVARGKVTMLPETLDLIVAGNIKKGDVFTISQLAGVMGAKKTSDLIPLCHPLALDHAASKSIVHRDIKPANLMIKRDGTVKLAINGKFVNGVRGSSIKKGYLCL